MTKIYLACYRGRADKLAHRIFDGITKFFTRGKYSHCEIAIALPNGRYDCYSSSVRDGGVRCKSMRLPSDKWDLLPLSDDKVDSTVRYFHKTRGAGYDFFGALGSVALFAQSDERFFCSEWCFNAIFGTAHGWRFSPSDLYDVLESLNE